MGVSMCWRAQDPPSKIDDKVHVLYQLKFGISKPSHALRYMDADDRLTFSSTLKDDRGSGNKEHIDDSVALPREDPTTPVTDDTSSPSTKERLKDLGRAAKTTAKHILHIDNTKSDIHYGSNISTQLIRDDAALNPSKVLDTQTSTAQQIKAKIPMPHSAKDLKEMILHPRSTTQNQYAEIMAVGENPHLRGDEDGELVEAHERLVEACGELEHIEQDCNDVVQDGTCSTSDEVARLHGKIEGIERDREEKQVAWITSRYVHSARILSSTQQHAFPLLSSCRWISEDGEPQGHHWSQWQSHVQEVIASLLHPSPQQPISEDELGEIASYDQDMLLLETERILIASTSLQRWLANLCKLRSWHSPRRTAFWLLSWLLIWASNRVFTFLYCYVAYRAFQTKTDFDEREILKEARYRAKDDDEMNNTFGEMVASFGSEKWLQPTMEIVGPSLQSCLRSTADWLEILSNFPDYKTSRAKRSIMVILGSAIVLSSLLSTEICLRASTLLLILLFFVDAPLEKRFPKYRHIIVPVHWIFWDVPTMTETAFAHLRKRAEVARLRLDGDILNQRDEKTTGVDTSSTSPKTRTPTPQPLFAEEAIWQDTTGTILITPSEISFTRKIPKREMWRKDLCDVVSISKGDGETSMLHRTSHVAELEFRDGSVVCLRGCVENDMLFNVVFAFSGGCFGQT